MILAAASFLALFGLLFIGVPIAFGMLLVGLVGFGIVIGWFPALSMAGQVATDTVLSYELSVLPLFIVMGNFVARAGLSTELFRASNAFVGHYRGGLAMATVLACGGFSTVCGSSLATAATMTKVAVPAMRQHRYSDRLATGTVAAGGTLGILIPPSVPLVIFGAMTQSDVGKLFAAGLIPGLLLVGLFVAAVVASERLRPGSGPPAEHATWVERRQALSRIWGVALLFSVVMGGIYFGVFTPTEAAGVGAAGALCFAIGRRSLTPRDFVETVAEAGTTSAMMFMVLIGALVFSNFLNVARAPNLVVDAILELKLDPLAFITIVILLFLILGCVLESLSMMLLLVPMLYPAVSALGYDMIWFGILVVVLIELSLITPPVGLNVYMIKALLPDVPMSVIFSGILPFVVAGLLMVALLVAFPEIALVLPNLMR